MTTENIFEYATRKKIRFPYKGMISTEDLWDLSLTNLDMIFKALNKQLKQDDEESLLSVKRKNTDLEVQIAIIKYIVHVKMNEHATAEKAAIKKEQKQRLLSIIADKEDEALQNRSVDDLKKMLEELGE